MQRAFRKGKGQYYVRPRDSLQFIANLHSVSVDDLKNWNKLRDELIEPGQVLLVFPQRPTRGLPPPPPQILIEPALPPHPSRPLPHVPRQNATVANHIAFFDNLGALTTRPRR
jgi:LysM repeat protein